jgi:hypothetical protein
VLAGLRRSRETPQPRQVGQLQSPIFSFTSVRATELRLCSVNFIEVGPGTYDFTLRLLYCALSTPRHEHKESQYVLQERCETLQDEVDRLQAELARSRKDTKARVEALVAEFTKVRVY